MNSSADCSQLLSKVLLQRFGECNSINSKQQHEQRRHKSSALVSLLKRYQNDKPSLGALLLDQIIVPLLAQANCCCCDDHDHHAPRRVQLIDDIIATCLDSRLIDTVDDLRNLYDKTLLHVACERHDHQLAEMLVVKYEADFLRQDMYHETPLSIASKQNNLLLLATFTTHRPQRRPFNDDNDRDHTSAHLWEIGLACQRAASCNYVEVMRLLFDAYDLNTNSLCSMFSSSSPTSANVLELSSPLHVAGYNGHSSALGFLVAHAPEPLGVINRPMNRFRTSTPLEEVFKGMLVGPNMSIEFMSSIDLLVANGARFSPDFVANRELSKLLANTGRDKSLVHFLKACRFLFKYKLSEVLNNDATNEALEEFMFDLYAVCVRVVKDHKSACLLLYVRLLLDLYGTRQVRLGDIGFLKEKNADAVHQLVSEEMLAARTHATLKSHCYLSIRKSMANFSWRQVNALTLPSTLKHELFNHINWLSKSSWSENRFVCFPYI